LQDVVFVRDLPPHPVRRMASKALACLMAPDECQMRKLLLAPTLQRRSVFRTLQRRVTPEGEGITQDDREAAVWYRRAAEQDVAEAQFNLGVRYAKGEGVPQDDREAVSWFRSAAEQGDADAQANLGVMYVQGEGVPQDHREGVGWIRRAAEQGHTGAQELLLQLGD
jgi:hypothetical protein